MASILERLEAAKVEQVSRPYSDRAGGVIRDGYAQSKKWLFRNQVEEALSKRPSSDVWNFCRYAVVDGHPRGGCS
jgi:hypothetical protein